MSPLFALNICCRPSAEAPNLIRYNLLKTNISSSSHLPPLPPKNKQTNRPFPSVQIFSLKSFCDFLSRNLSAFITSVLQRHFNYPILFATEMNESNSQEYILVVLTLKANTVFSWLSLVCHNRIPLHIKTWGTCPHVTGTVRASPAGNKVDHD